MITGLVKDSLESSDDIRQLYGRVALSFYAEGGETVLDVANPNGNYSLFMKHGFNTPLENAIDEGRKYECINPGNSRGRNELGIEFRKIDGLNAGNINSLLSDLGTSQNLYMVVMGTAQLLTYGSQKRLKTLGVDVNLDDPDERDRAMIELFSKRVTEMNVPYLMISDGLKEGSGNIDRQNIPVQKVELLEKDLAEKGWNAEVFRVEGNFVLVAER